MKWIKESKNTNSIKNMLIKFIIRVSGSQWQIENQKRLICRNLFNLQCVERRSLTFACLIICRCFSELRNKVQAKWHWLRKTCALYKKMNFDTNRVLREGYPKISYFLPSKSNEWSLKNVTSHHKIQTLDQIKKL